VSSFDLARVKVILLDIEGTTTPVDFVYGTLFGYAKTRLETFLEAHRDVPEVRRCVAELKSEHAMDEREGRMPPLWTFGMAGSEIASAAKYGLWLMDRDSKTGPLKAIQGLIWEQGYRSGELKGQVYPDVPRAFDRWRSQSKNVAIYSSGSELAQRLLFSTTQFGDLSLLISAFFDTRVGRKTQVQSYQKIASSLGCSEGRFLFLSDVVVEVDAARSAGMQTALVVRGEDRSIDPQGHPVLTSFDAL
jgi:enolase-phosphatase E1